MKLFILITLGGYFLYKLLAGAYLLTNWDKTLNTPSEKEVIDVIAKGKKWVYWFGLVENAILLGLVITNYYI